MQVIEYFSLERTPDGTPVLAIVEDERGFRWLSSDFPVADATWRYSLSSNILGIRTLEGREISNETVANLPRSPDGNIIWFEVEQRRASRRFIHLHAHSEYSPLDGLATIQEMVREVKADGQDAISLTDHGVCAGHLELQKVCQAEDVKPIFGIEAYLVPNAADRESKDYWHFILWAQNEVGLRNLWALSTEAYMKGFYYRPRMDWDMLSRHSEGLAAATACLRGPLATAVVDDDHDAFNDRLGRLQGIYGDRLFLELHTNSLPEQVKVNQALVAVSQERSVPLIVVADSHYACSGDHDAHQVWIAMQTNKSLQDEADLFGSDDRYHISGVREVEQAISYLGSSVVDEAIANTGLVADMCDVTIKPRVGTPTYHRKHIPESELQGADLDRQKMIDICLENWPSKLGHIPDEKRPIYEKQFWFEIEELSSKGFAGYMLIVWDYCDWARRHNILIGPGRGSAAGSIVCYLLGITGVEPIAAELMFERFLSPGRTELPDIDVDFPSSKREAITNYIIERWGKEHVVRVGTVGRLRNKGVLKGVARTFQGTPDEVDFMDQKAMAALVDEVEAGTSGLGLPWEDLMTQQAEPFAPFIAKYPKLFEYAEKLVGRLNVYGRHPAGILIDPEHSIIDSLPMRVAEEEGQVITEFPMDQLGFLNLVKFDILTLRTLDTMQEVMDLVAADPNMAGFEFNPNNWRIEYEDPQVWDALSSGDTMGVFQVETAAGTTLTKKLRPHSLADMSAIGTLVRPGPMRSGQTTAYLRRREGNESVTFAHPLLEELLDQNYGLMIYQEDIMRVCQVLAGYTSAEADEVRSILGKKKVEKIPAEGQRFVSRCVNRGVDQSIADALWDQMKEHAKYSFNRAHSWSYGMLGYWCAWAKVHLPAHFLVAALNTADKERIPDFVILARALGYKVLPPDVNDSQAGFAVSGDRLGIRYGIASVKGLGGAKADAIISQRPFHSFEELAQSKVDYGSITTLARVGALDSLIPEGHNRNDLLSLIERASSKGIERCAWMGQSGMPMTLTDGTPVSCTFDWASEVKLGKSGKPLKPKPIPKRCSRACRNYTPDTTVIWPNLLPPTAKDVRAHERELLGIYVSHSPFDAVDPALMEEHKIASMADYEAGPIDDHFRIMAEVASVRTRQDKNKRHMGFVTLTLPDGSMDAVVFASDWERDASMIKPDAFGLFLIVKGHRGPVYRRFFPIIQQETAHATV